MGTPVFGTFFVVVFLVAFFFVVLLAESAIFVALVVAFSFAFFTRVTPFLVALAGLIVIAKSVSFNVLSQNACGVSEYYLVC